MSNQSGVQQAIRDSTGTSGAYAEDWHALWDDAAIAAGTFNERMLAWANDLLGTSYTNVNEAQHALAVDQGFNNWSSANTLVLSNEASDFAADEAKIFVAIFTAAGTGGHSGRVFIRNDSGAETLLFTESNGFAVDFTDSHFVSTGHYGSAVIKEA